MLSDVVSPSNYLTFNVTIAQIIGLVNAVYCAELLDIYAKAKRKNKIDDNQFFPVNRDYVKSKTTIKVEEQYLCDASLSSVGLIETHKDSPDMIKFDVEQFMQIIAGEDSEKVLEIQKKINLPKNKTIANKLKKDKIKENLHNLIVCDNVRIKQALDEWLDTLFDDKFIKKETVLKFQEVLYEYTKSDVEKAVEIIHIAISQGWTNCVYAIESYEKEQKLLANKQVRTTQLKVATQDKLSKKKY